MSHGDTGTGSILKQPKAVWAVAFACVVAFMGIGLVDPILPAIAADLQATPTETEFLFTSYLVITGIAMFFTSWVSSRIGAKKTLLIGLAVIVVFAAAAGLSGDVESIIGFRAGWGLGNALFISTALATIVGAASGGTSSAIILYEAALGLGLAIGPLVGGVLGSWSWRGPFFGTAVLMAIGFIAISTLLRSTAGDEKPVPTAFSAPFRALGRPALAILAATAVFYNFGFFVLLAYTPFALVPLGVSSAISLGFVFFGWGVAVAVSSVWLAPMLTARMRRTRVIWTILPLLALDLVAIALLIHSVVGIVVFVVVGGLLLGIMNTVLTESVMEATDLPRSVASSAYSGVRFLGGAVAPPVASLLAANIAEPAPFIAGAIAFVVATLIVIVGRRALAASDGMAELDEAEQAEAVLVGDAA
ncbi:MULTISPECIES: MFS transporter [unclassified Leifsonia]|uniref:MFS transporter n=1 Tax=unclassified Leifsonia TaxID=2663824 RepID=UPI0006FE639F|nr:MULTISPECIES: MFS transporter [unclassified Leifsonia]KQX05491.1 MFS transporter [Leifsonia sp. Root1293]KRA09124.1 MFS transporter [Leifsonia sp. Root60]